jgi:azurin
MKTRFLSLAAVAALVLAGCSKPEQAAAPVAAAPQSGPRTIEITGNDAMKFNVIAIELAVGEEVRIVLNNIGSMPKQAMGHNLVVLKPGTDTTAFATAAAAAVATDYIPAALADQIIAHTKLLGPKQSDSIIVKFDAPGEYPYVCSFPAHTQMGMKGVITVK